MRLRLDHFFPFLTRKKPRPAPAPVRLLFPTKFFSDPATARPGLARRALKRLGETWLSAPFRRVFQAGCFVIFLVLFFWVAWPYGSPDYAKSMSRREVVDAEFVLALDPLVSISTAIAGRTWVWSLGFAAVMLATGFLFPRGFCGYVCPLGTLIDLFDWAVGKRVTRFRVRNDGWWVNLKYYLLVGTLVASMFGVLLTGFVAAIPVITRGFLFTLAPIQSGLARGWYLVPAMNAGHVVSLVLFVAVLAMGLWRPRFWCRYVCPTGAVFSAFNAARATERKVESSCISCNRCIEVCPFDAIKADFTTRTAECTLCQTCGGVCPTHSIKFVERWNRIDLKKENDPPVSETPVARRGFLAGIAAGAAAALSTKQAWGADLGAAGLPIRPPGSVPEKEFLQLCIRCGECFKACPNDVLQPQGFEQGLEGLWTPVAKPSWSGCEPTCNNCGQVCPTGAIRALPIEEKAAAHMGLALINEQTCLPHAGAEACQMCVDECNAAGYRAIEFRRVHVEVDAEGQPLPDSGFAAPVMIPDLCVGCGLCQTRCHGINVVQKKLLQHTAIEIFAGPGRDDRMMKGSYVELHRKKEAAPAPAAEGDYLPDFLKDK
jgi:polyferredoxin